MKNLGFVSTLANRLRKWLGWCPETPKLVDDQKTASSSFALGKPRLIAVPVALTAGYCLVASAIEYVYVNDVMSVLYPSPYNQEQYYLYGFVTCILKLLLDIILLFAVSYFVGKKLDLKYDLVSIIISLFLGSLIVYVPFEIYFGAFAMSLSQSLTNLFSMILGSMEVFLVSFAGMVVGYLRKRNISFYEFRLGIGLNNLRINWKILGWTMSSLIIVEGLISLAEDYLMINVADFELFQNQYSPLLSFVRVLIYPILFVVVLYMIGRNLNIEAFPIIAFPLFIGCFVGLLVGNLTPYLDPFRFNELERWVSQLETGGIATIYVCFSFAFSLIYHFILGLSALAVGSLTKKELSQEEKIDFNAHTNKKRKIRLSIAEKAEESFWQ
jgi:hypothetical protein